MKITVTYNHDEFVALRNASIDIKANINNNIDRSLELGAIPHEIETYHSSFKYDDGHIEIDLRDESVIRTLTFITKIVAACAPFYSSVKSACKLVIGMLRSECEKYEKDMEVPMDYYKYGVIEQKLFGETLKLYARRQGNRVSISLAIGYAVDKKTMAGFARTLANDNYADLFNLTYEQFVEVCKANNVKADELCW